MRLFAIGCFGIAVFYGYLAVEAMRTGIATSLVKHTEVPHRRDDPASNYQKYLLARWLLAGGFAVLGVSMRMLARKFEELDARA